MADDKKAQEEAGSPFALGAASPLAPGADSSLSLSPQPKGKTVTANLGGPAPGALRPGPPSFDSPRPLDIAAGESEKPPDPRVPSSYPGMRKVLKAMSDPPKPKQGEPVTWIDPDYDERTGPVLERLMAPEREPVESTAAPRIEASGRSFDVALAAYAAIFGAGAFQLANHDWISGLIFSVGGGIGLMSIHPLIRPKLQVFRSNRSLWAMVTMTWLFLAVNVGFTIYDHFWPKAAPSQVSIAPDVWPPLSESQASALSARAQFLPPENIVVACETIKCRDLADGIAAILNKTPNWKASILHRGGLDISGVVGIQLIPNEPATQQLKDAIEATTGLAVTLIETRKDMGTDTRTFLTVGTRPF
jgi:hypothetical protein